MVGTAAVSESRALQIRDELTDSVDELHNRIDLEISGIGAVQLVDGVRTKMWVEAKIWAHFVLPMPTLGSQCRHTKHWLPTEHFVNRKRNLNKRGPPA